MSDQRATATAKAEAKAASALVTGLLLIIHSTASELDDAR